MEEQAIKLTNIKKHESKIINFAKDMKIINVDQNKVDKNFIDKRLK